jgi:hypothetical protein
MRLHRITGFLDERVEFERTWQRVGVWLMETLLQSAAIQADDRSTKVLLSQPRIKFLLFLPFLRDLKICEICEIRVRIKQPTHELINSKTYDMKKETWKFVIQTILAVLTAIATSFGVTSCIG